MKRKIFRTLLIPLTLIVILNTISYFQIKTSHIITTQAVDNISDENAAWKIIFSGEWKSVPKNSVNGNVSFLNNDNKILLNRTIGNNPTTYTCFSLNLPEKLIVSVPNNKFTAKTYNWNAKFYYQNVLVKELSDSHYFATTLSKNYSASYNIKNDQISSYTLNIDSTNINNYSSSTLCKSFDIPSNNLKMPYVNGHTFKVIESTSGEVQKTFNEIPLSKNEGEFFLGYYGKYTDIQYFDEELLPTGNNYNSNDGNTLIAKFGKPIKTEYNLSLYYDREMKNPYSDNNYKTYKIDQEKLLPVVPNTNFMTYNGWYEVINGAISSDISYSIPKNSAGDKIFVLNSSKISYSVTLNTNGATTCSPLTYYVSGSETILPIPSRNGYNFIGWYDNPEFNNYPITKINSNDYGNKTYYAKWEGARYSVTLNTVDADSCPSLTSYVCGVGATLPTPIRRGYTFKGWYDNKSYNGSPIYSISPTESGNKTYYAKWEMDLSNESAYRIICRAYLASKSESAINVLVKLYDENNVCYYQSKTIQVDNQTSANNPDSFVCDVISTFLPNKIVFEWQRDYKFGYAVKTSHSVCDVYYKGQKIDSASFDQNLAVAVTSKVYSSPQDCTTEKEKNKQYLSKNASLSSFSFANNVVNGVFNAQTNDYGPIILNNNYLKSDGSISTISYNKPQLVDDNNKNLPLSGYFDINATNKYYDADLNPTNPISNDGLILYPGFTQTLNLNSNGGTLSYNKDTYLAGLNDSLPVANKTGYTFIGWCRNQQLTDTPITSISPSEKNPLTLYAKFKPLSYTIRLINTVNDEEIIDPFSAEHDSYLDKNIFLNNVGEWEDNVYHYFFKDFYTSKDCNQLYNFSTPVSGPTNIYAGYNKKELTYYHLDNFVKDYMHPEIDIDNNQDTNLCRCENGYYESAKESFNKLSDTEKDMFFQDDEYFYYGLRLRAWATANGESFNQQTKKLSPLNSYRKMFFDEKDSESQITILIICSSAVCLLFASSILIFKLRKRK